MTTVDFQPELSLETVEDLPPWTEDTVSDANIRVNKLILDSFPRGYIFYFDDGRRITKEDAFSSRELCNEVIKHIAEHKLLEGS